MMDSIMEDVYALLRSAIESEDHMMYLAIYEEWREYIQAAPNESIEVKWIPQITSTK